MHMANELISFPVAGVSIGIAGGVLGWICKSIRQDIISEKAALMGVLGAFVFAAQMINFQLPLMPGTSGHLIGAVFLAVMLGPHLAAVVLSSVVIIQCLLFQDGGLLALGCNLLNIAIVPSYIGYYVYRLAAGNKQNKSRLFTGVVAACVVVALAGSAMVVLQASISGVLLIPPVLFLATMSGVHLLVGIMEGMITVAMLGYLASVRPDLIVGLTATRAVLSRNGALISLAVMTLITAAGFSLLASDKPDGLEWSYLERPEQPDFKPVVANSDQRMETADKLHGKIAVMPDYSLGDASELHSASAGWTSVAGIVGSAACMGLIWLTAKLMRPRRA